MDPVELRLQKLYSAREISLPIPLGWTYDSGNYKGAMDVALDKIGYNELRKEQEEKRKKGELMGIGISSFTEIVGAGPAHTFDICGIKMFDSAEIRVHPTGKAIAAWEPKPGARTRDDIRANCGAGARNSGE